MRIFQFTDYRHFIRFRLESPDAGNRGELSRLAAAMGVKRPYLSQVLSGSKNLSHEQAHALSQHYHLNDLERRYLYELVHLSKASKPAFQASIRAEMDRLREEAAGRRGEASPDQPLDEQSQVVFYSSWTYSAAQLLTGLPGGQTADQIADRLRIDQKSARNVLAFLVSTGLCTTDGVKYFAGTRATHLAKDSPFRPRHHTNWRLKGLDQLGNRAEDDTFFTAAVRLDEKSFEKIRAKLREVIAEVRVAIDEADDTQTACLNIDWFKF